MYSSLDLIKVMVSEPSIACPVKQEEQTIGDLIKAVLNLRAQKKLHLITVQCLEKDEV